MLQTLDLLCSQHDVAGQSGLTLFSTVLTDRRILLERILLRTPERAMLHRNRVN